MLKKSELKNYEISYRLVEVFFIIFLLVSNYMFNFEVLVIIRGVIMF